MIILLVFSALALLSLHAYVSAAPPPPPPCLLLSQVKGLMVIPNNRCSHSRRTCWSGGSCKIYQQV